MKIAGVIAEYNPFHNGHLYHLQKIKSELRPDGIVCAMSGNFVQRGEPAVFDKWARAEMALAGGADLVFELPVCFSTATAEIFAESAVKLLSKTRVVNILSFGIEEYRENELFILSRLLAEEPEPYRNMVKNHLKKGASFPLARERAAVEYLSSQGADCDAEAVSKLLKKPNSILAIEYIKAIIKTGSSLTVYPVIRKGAGYHDKTLGGTFPSASAIRHALSSTENPLQQIAGNVPLFTFEIIKKEMEKGRGPVFLKDFETVLLFLLRRMAVQDMTAFFDVEEGLENRILRAARESGTLEELIAGIKSKRYPATRIQRILIHLLLNIDREIVISRDPLYLRVLGFTEKGLKILKQIKKESSLPILTRASEGKKLDLRARKMFEADLFSSDIYSLAFKSGPVRKGGTDFSKRVVYLSALK
ncbi:nucleotidyltransferase [Thermoanaerobacterium sp. DL9XJH110]|uniref:nucleotidyltransferase n=1 Tax=Thermoanaerobacterium sp. DL9XJH110 TaxID=3386643 RepID=UPI003BB54744